jgi:hypothetical protein
MTFLPIVERELRVAARKRSTFWLRIVAALVALVIGSGFLLLNLLLTRVGGAGTVNLGAGLFAALTWLNLAAALSAGLFFTSDCLSEEKREGTLGFLFLTDLRGYDVVLGKLLAAALRGSYALLAVFPILAVTLVMGGVTGAQFWKTVLALVNALFFSLAAGMFVSAISRDSQKALGATVLFLLLLVAGGPASDGTFAAVKQRGFDPVLSLTSPAYVFATAGAWGRNRFWIGLFTCQIIAWALLGSACLLVPRTWQEKSRKTATSKESWSYRLKYGGVNRRARLRRKLIELNPVMWLACRERWQSAAIWTMAILVLGTFIALLVSDLPPDVWAVWSFVGGALALGFYLWTASQACRFFVEARRSGLVELMLETPLTVKDIVRGQWGALQRMFGLPVALFLCTQLFAGALSHQASWSGVRMSGGGPNLAVTMIMAAASVVVMAANLIALSWFGMWMGLTSKSANLATLKTLVFVCVIPGFVITFAAGLLIPLVMFTMVSTGISSTRGSFAVWFPTLIPLLSMALTSVLSLGKSVFFSLWARRKLYSSFRERAALSVVPVRFVAPPPLPRPVAPPPVISVQS